jgi:alpha-amylase
MFFMNKTMIQYFHWYTKAEGLLWKEISEKAEWLASIGITAAWLPPAYKAAAGKDSVGYDVYDLYDLGEFDQKGSVKTKYGSREEYEQAIKSLQKNNMEAIVDIVLNHKAVVMKQKNLWL